MAYKVIGHRGDKVNFVENTLAGFDAILQNPEIDGFEFDVVMSKDKKLLISHDRFIIDTCGHKQYIHNLTYTELLAINKMVNSNEEKNEERYPLLEEVLDLYANQSHKKMMLLEIKSIPASGVLPLTIPELVENVHRRLKRYSISDTCTIISFDYRIIKESYKQDKKRNIGLILHHNLIPLSSIINDLPISLLVMAKNWITKEQVDEMNKYDIDIFSWTPNTDKEWIRLDILGIKGLITDKPEVLSLFRKVHVDAI